MPNLFLPALCPNLAISQGQSRARMHLCTHGDTAGTLDSASPRPLPRPKSGPVHQPSPTQQSKANGRLSDLVNFVSYSILSSIPGTGKE